VNRATKQMPRAFSGKRGKTPGKLCKVEARYDIHRCNGGGFPPFLLLATTHAAPACPHFCPSYIFSPHSHGENALAGEGSPSMIFLLVRMKSWLPTSVSATIRDQIRIVRNYQNNSPSGTAATSMLPVQ
jgi:hypothetical protein